METPDAITPLTSGRSSEGPTDALLGAWLRGRNGHIAARTMLPCLVVLIVCSAVTYHSPEPSEPTRDPLVFADHGGGRHSLLLPVQEEERRGPGAQHQRRGLQLQLLPQKGRPICRWVWEPQRKEMVVSNRNVLFNHRD